MTKEKTRIMARHRGAKAERGEERMNEERDKEEDDVMVVMMTMI